MLSAVTLPGPSIPLASRLRPKNRDDVLSFNVHRRGLRIAPASLRQGVEKPAVVVAIDWHVVVNRQRAHVVAPVHLDTLVCPRAPPELRTPVSTQRRIHGLGGRQLVMNLPRHVPSFGQAPTGCLGRPAILSLPAIVAKCSARWSSPNRARHFRGDQDSDLRRDENAKPRRQASKSYRRETLVGSMAASN